MLGLLQHRLNLWPSQKVRSQRLIPDALCQPPDGPRRLTKGCLCLRRFANYLIQPSQRRLDLPTFGWQPQVCGQLGGLGQVADGLLWLPIPRLKQSH